MIISIRMLCPCREKTAVRIPPTSSRCASAGAPLGSATPAIAESRRQRRPLKSAPSILTPGQLVGKVNVGLNDRLHQRGGPAAAQRTTFDFHESEAFVSNLGGLAPTRETGLGDTTAIRHQSLGSGAWSTYNLSLQTNPLLTKAVVMALGLATGDVLAQMLHTGGHVDDLTRTAHIAFFGLTVQGPAVHCLHTFLDKHIRPNDPTSIRAVLSKMLIDQGLFAPVAVAAYIGYMQLAGGNASPDDIALVLQSSWAPTLQANYMLWPAALLVNYSLCPPQHRILFVNMVTVVWSAVLSSSTAC